MIDIVHKIILQVTVLIFKNLIVFGCALEEKLRSIWTLVLILVTYFVFERHIIIRKSNSCKTQNKTVLSQLPFKMFQLLRPLEKSNEDGG
jgi:hypothetical protein